MSPTPAVNLPAASIAPAVHLDLQIFSRIFEKINLMTLKKLSVINEKTL